MPKYMNTQQDVRCEYISIQNPDREVNPSATPTIEFSRHLVTREGGFKGVQPVDSCRIALTGLHLLEQGFTGEELATKCTEMGFNLMTAFPRVSPADDTEMGEERTFLDFFIDFYSVFAYVSRQTDERHMLMQQLNTVMQQTGQGQVLR